MFKSADQRLLTQANNKIGTADAEPDGQHVAPRAAPQQPGQVGRGAAGEPDAAGSCCAGQELISSIALENVVCGMPSWTIKAAVMGDNHPKVQERPVYVIQMAAAAKEAVRKFCTKALNTICKLA